VYIIGAGAIARHHVAAIAKLPRPTRVVLSVAEPDAMARASFTQDVPRARVVDDARAMLSEAPRSDDIVIVATPAFVRRDMTIMSLATGRHVLCEKPLAMNREQAREMLQTARAHDRLLGCCSSRFLGTPTTEEVKRLIHTDALGPLYHVNWINRNQRDRAGVEYQPASHWPLDRSKSGGGIVQDWGPYDIAALNDLLAPVAVDVVSAWLTNPITALNLPPDTVFDVEEHAGATMCYHLPNGNDVTVTYEAAACTHAEARSLVEVEGLGGAARWDWLCLQGHGDVVHAFDNGGKPDRMTRSFACEDQLTAMDRPLVYFDRRVRGEGSLAVVNEQAIFNFSCLRAIYDCASSGQPQTVRRVPA